MAVEMTDAREGELAQYAASIARLSAADQLQGVIDSLANAVLAGETFDAWKDRALAGEIDFGLPAASLSTTMRTNVQSVYNAGRYTEQMSDLANRPFWMYEAINDSRTRESHHEMSGFTAPAVDPIWKKWYPPAGYNCRCSVISLTEEEAIARGYKPGDQPPNVEPDQGFGFNSAARGLDAVLNEAVAARHASLSPELMLGLDTALKRN